MNQEEIDDLIDNTIHEVDIIMNEMSKKTELFSDFSYIAGCVIRVMLQKLIMSASEFMCDEAAHAMYNLITEDLPQLTTTH